MLVETAQALQGMTQLGFIKEAWEIFWLTAYAAKRLPAISTSKSLRCQRHSDGRLLWRSSVPAPASGQLENITSSAYPNQHDAKMSDYTAARCLCIFE